MMQSTRHPADQHGYILVMTIAALALLALIGAFTGQRISTALNLAALEQTDLEQERQAHNLFAKAIFLTTTSLRTPIGLGTDGGELLRLDGRWYDAGNGMAISFQDARGLINLRTAPRLWKERLLVSYGLNLDQNNQLLDALEDYVDEDDLVRQNGAERAAYLNRELPAPRNQRLVSVYELHRVYGWDDAEALWGDDPVTEHVVIADHTGLNPATATVRALMAGLGMEESQARTFVEARRNLNIAETRLLTKATIQQSAQSFLQLHTAVLFPSPTIVVTIAPKGSRSAWRSTVTATPTIISHPWRQEELHRLRLPEAAPSRGLPPLPRLADAKVDIDRVLEMLPTRTDQDFSDQDFAGEPPAAEPAETGTAAPAN